MTLSAATPTNQPILHRVTLDNGLTVVVIENPVADIVSARLLINAGTAREPRSQAGLFSLLSSLLTKGTQNLSSMEIAERVESV
ncbi:MAG: insulinase family protein, partial [Cyanobacteria bacterium P01_E01_bin.43]